MLVSETDKVDVQERHCKERVSLRCDAFPQPSLALCRV